MIKRRELDMTLDKDIKNKLLHIDWLSNCGKQEELDISNEYIYIKNTKEIEKTLKGVKWRNVCMDARNDLTVFLTLNNLKAYHSWNPMVDEVKEDIIANVSDTIQERCKVLDLPEKMFPNIRMAIINIALTYSYKKYYDSVFYDDMLKIYESGHLPCGWVGSYSKGKFKVY